MALENEIEKLSQAILQEPVSPQMLVQARQLARQAEELARLARQLVLDVASHSPDRVSLRALELVERHKTQPGLEPAPVTTDIVRDLKSVVDRIDAAEFNLLVGLGWMAQRIAAGHQDCDVYSQHVVELQQRPQMFWQQHDAYTAKVEVTNYLSDASAVHPEWARDMLVPQLRSRYPEARVLKRTTRVYLEEDAQFRASGGANGS